MNQSIIINKLIQDEKYTEIINSGIKNAAFDMTNNPNAKIIFTNYELVKYFIDNNIDAFNYSNYWRLIHYVCRYSTDYPEGIDMLKNIIDAYLKIGFNIGGGRTKDGWSSIHFICRYSINSPKGIEMIKYILDIYLKKYYKIDYITNDGWAPIHFICRYAPNTQEGIGLVKYIFNIYKEHNLNEKQKTYQQLTPMCYYEMSEKSVFDLF